MKRIISKILKEEFNNRISREDYVDKILDILVDDTIFDFKGNNIRFPFHSPPVLPFRLFPNPLPAFLFYLSSFPPSPFSKYCKDMYGLTENETYSVWQEYKNIILDKINNKESINESTGKISREDYLNKIVDYLVEDTIVDFKKNEIRFPFSPTLQYFHPLSSPISLFNHLILFFSKYCKYNYDLTENEMDYVWNEYKNIIWDKINEVYPDEV